ncbi:Protein CBG26789 [Caenorhabditis briggsae]|uniref:Protein CBG26789 n=1 Tax=Caenorhabditis briggsae TaxID=6238 RepID=B6IHA1_CAEBR|nr:Protein CBG26789 [Caenorhabditis briggsae]CAR99281.1 Protein CBG26789 [Caenorhabditis briggsae]
MCTDTEDCLHHQRLRRQVSPPSTSSEAQAATSSSSSGFFVDLAACGRRTLAVTGRQDIPNPLASPEAIKKSRLFVLL